jgi:hypothetical protein
VYFSNSTFGAGAAAWGAEGRAVWASAGPNDKRIIESGRSARERTWFRSLFILGLPFKVVGETKIVKSSKRTLMGEF